MSSFSELPTELVIEIGCLLPGSAIKALRLTSRFHKSAISHFLFPRVYVSAHRSDLDILKQISENPELAKGVKELAWDGACCGAVRPDQYNDKDVRMERLQDYTEALEVEQRARRIHFCDKLDEQELPGPSFVLRDLEEYTEDRDTVRHNNDDMRVLLEALPRLSNLRSVVFCSSKFFQDFTDLETLCAPSTRSTLSYFKYSVLRVEEESWEDLAREERADIFDFDPFDICGPPNLDLGDADRLDQFRGYNLLLLACTTSSGTIRRFSMLPPRTPYNRSGPCGNNFPFIFESWSDTLDRMQDAFVHLEVLHLCFQDYRGDNSRGILLNGNVAKIISSCTGLRELKIDNSDCNTPLSSHLPTISVLDPKNPLPKLRRGIFISGEEAFDRTFEVIRAYSASLEYLELRSIKLLTGSWVGLLEELRDSSDAAELKTVDLVCDLVVTETPILPVEHDWFTLWSTVEQPVRGALWTKFLDGGAFPLKESFQDFEDPSMSLPGNLKQPRREGCLYGLPSDNGVAEGSPVRTNLEQDSDSLGPDWDMRMEEAFGPLHEGFKLYTPSSEESGSGSSTESSMISDE